VLSSRTARTVRAGIETDYRALIERLTNQITSGKPLWQEIGISLFLPEMGGDSSRYEWLGPVVSVAAGPWGWGAAG
jgi:hypothetical protein